MRLRRLRNIGQESKYNHTLIGYNYRMTEVAASVGIAQVQLIDEFSRRRQANAAYITRELSMLEKEGITLPYISPDSKHVFHQYTIMIDSDMTGFTRDTLSDSLNSFGVETGMHYPAPIYTQPCFEGCFDSFGSLCPVTEKASRTVLSLPVHPCLTEKDLEHIVQAFQASLR
jgi:perosamine synthetase